MLGVGLFGFSMVWVVFDFKGMMFDWYFDLFDVMNMVDKFVVFIVGIVLFVMYWCFIDLFYVDIENCMGLLVGFVCYLVFGVVVVEVLKILFGYGCVYVVFYFY